jgi:hypothetical protein
MWRVNSLLRGGAKRGPHCMVRMPTYAIHDDKDLKGIAFQ